MIWLCSLIGLALGIGLGLYFNITISIVYAQYLTIALIAAVDAIFGGYVGVLKKEFDTYILLSGFLCNTLLGVAFTYIGIRLGVDIYLAVVVVFAYRIFANFGTLRRLLMENSPAKSSTRRRNMLTILSKRI